jgi:hypothetical protein
MTDNNGTRGQSATFELAIKAAFFDCYFDAGVKPEDIEENDSWDDICNEVKKNLKRLSPSQSVTRVSRYDLAKVIWNMSKDEFDEEMNGLW